MTKIETFEVIVDLPSAGNKTEIETFRASGRGFRLMTRTDDATG